MVLLVSHLCACVFTHCLNKTLKSVSVFKSPSCRVKRSAGVRPCCANAWMSASALIVVASSIGPKLGSAFLSISRMFAYRASLVTMFDANSRRRFTGPPRGTLLSAERSRENDVATLAARNVTFFLVFSHVESAFRIDASADAFGASSDAS